MLWVLNKNAADRPTDADQLITVLEHCREAITSAGAGQHTASMAAVAAAGAAIGSPGLAAYQEAQAQATNGSGEMSAVHPIEERERRSWVVWGGVLLVVLLIAGAAAAAYFLTRPKQVLVPKVTGQQIASARTTVEQAKFQVSTVSVPNRRPPGIVVSESPAAGTKADKGSTVTLSVSSGPGKVSVPSVQGLSVAQATKVLRKAGLKVGNVVPQASNRFAAGQVTSTNPGTAKSVPHGAGVTLFVSSGQPQKKVPNVLGENQTQANQDLTNAGFTVHANSQPTSTQGDVGNVISQNPSGNTNATAGSQVTITVGTAPATTTVPSVIGDPASGAASALHAAGFKVSQIIRIVSNPDKNGTVVAQSPGGNSSVKKGSTVTITVGQFQQTSTSSPPRRRPPPRPRRRRSTTTTTTTSSPSQ